MENKRTHLSVNTYATQARIKMVPLENAETALQEILTNQGFTTANTKEMLQYALDHTVPVDYPEYNLTLFAN